MLQQYQIQYGLDGCCCLRASWIMEKDDFRYAHTFGEDVFGGPRWCDEVDAASAKRYADAGAVPVMLDAEGQPMRRNFVHVEDLVSAILTALGHPAARQQLFHIAMNEPCQWRSKKGPPRRCKKGPLGGCGLVPVVHGRAPRATRRALNRLTRRRAREGPVGPRGQAWAGWSVQLAVGV